MKNLKNLLRHWRKRILVAAGIGLSFLGDHLSSGFVTDMISKRFSAITGIHEIGIVQIFYSHPISSIILVLLIIISYEAVRSKVVDEPSPNRITNTPVSRRYYMPVADAIKYIADESEWGKRKRAQPNERGMYEHPRFAAIDEFARAARAGEIVVLGCPNGAGEHQPIAQTYWLYHAVDLNTVVAGDQAGSTVSTSRAHLETFICYDMLTVDRSEVSRVWPRPKQDGLSRFGFRQSNRID